VRSFGALVAIVIAVFYLAAAAARADEPTQKLGEAPADLEQILMRGDFDRVDQLADEYRSTQIRMRGGRWVLSSFYSVIADFAGAIPACACTVDGSSTPFEAKRKQLELWFAAKPNSLTARVALASLWKNYASARRGGLYAAQTTDSNWQGYHEGLARANDLVGNVDPTTDPVIFSIKMQIAVGSEDPRPQLDDLYARAVKAFPTYVLYYSSRYRFLQERWFGQPGEAHAYLDSLLQSPGGDEGKIAYVEAATTALDFERTPASLLSFSGVSYHRLVDAFGARQRTVGLTDHDWNVLMYYAVAALDRNGVAFVAQKIGDHWEKALWGTKDSYERWVGWSARAL